MKTPEGDGLSLNFINLKIHWDEHKYPYILIFATILINAGIFKDLFSAWLNNDNYSHGFFIIPVSLYLIWRNRKKLVFPAKQSVWGLVLFVGGLFGLIGGIAASEFFSTRVSIIVIISGISLYHMGIMNFKKVWFAFVYLIFMIPVPAVIYYSATFPMQLFSSKITNFILQIIGMPSVRQGNLIYVSGYVLEVAEACSGLRSLVSLMALSSLYGYLTIAGKTGPVILFLAAVPVAIITNIARLVLTAIVAYAAGPQFAEGFLHNMAGVFVFAAAFLLIILTGSVIKWTIKHS